MQWRLDRDMFEEAYTLAKQEDRYLHEKSALVRTLVASPLAVPSPVLSPP